jgi:hypothetical protein
MRLPSLRLTSRRLRTAAALGLTLVVVVCFCGRFPQGDAAKLQGKWSVVAVEDSEVALNEPFLATRQYIFDGHRLINRAQGGPVATSLLGDWIGRNINSPSGQALA